METNSTALTYLQEFQPDKRKRLDDLPELPEGRPVLLLSAVYSGEEKKVYLKFYDPKDNVIYLWRDRTDHKPYCYTKMEFEDQAELVVQKETKYTIERVKKRDIISDKEIDVLKVIAPDPLSIGGTDTSFREKVKSWEADIKYHENYLYDRSLIPGLYYLRKDEQITPFEYSISEKVQFALKSLLWDKIKETGESGKEYRQYITNWANLLNQPVPELKRIAIDIEVESEEGRMSNPRDHDRRVTAVGFVASDGFRKVLVLANNTPSDGTPLITEAEPCNTEKELLEKAFRIINEYPIIITFNGDDFDLPYLYGRSQDSRIDPNGVAILRDKVPIMVKKESFIKRGMQAEPVGIRHGIHIDLYRTFDNRSIQIYAFSRAYTEHTLNAISEALLNDTKIEFDGDISGLPIQQLAEYCLKDADLTYRLTGFNDSLLMRLLVVIARIGRLSVDDIARFGVNQWIRGILYYEHRQRNELIPSRSELEAKGSASTTAVIKEKKYRGGEVVEPIPGIHFGVVVMDFASLYPSIIKVHNLSYETINCPHDDCREAIIEGTTHWVCKHRKGLTSLLIGSLRDLRVNYYKHLANDKTLPPQERQLYNVVSQAIKVILNAFFTADTEVLTHNGLRKITELKVGAKVYTLNEKTHKVEIKPIVEVQHYKYNDSLVGIKTKDIDWQVTGNHKLYLGKRKWGANGTTKIEFAKIGASDAVNTVGKRFLFRHEKIIDDNAKLDWCNLWKYIPDEQNTIIIKPNKKYDRKFANSPRFAHYEFASKLKHSKAGRYYLTSRSFIDSLAIGPQEFEDRYDCKIFVKNFPAKTSGYTKWSFKAPAVFELIGWCVTEGYARIGKSKRGYNFTRIAISQDSKHAANVSRIASMIQELGIKPEKQTDRVLSFGSRIIANFLISECGSGSRNKHLPSFVFSAPIELRKILFETMMCGDGDIKRGVYSSVSGKLADDFRHLAFTLGIETSVSKETLKSGSVIFRVKLFKREHHIVRPKDFALKPVENLDVYCITAQDNHVIYAGREGKLGWIGQSYGVMGAEIFPLYCLPVAEATAALGRSTINRTINKCKEIGIQVIYGDSVLQDTPVVIKRKDEGIDIVPVESLMPKSVTSSWYNGFGNIEVLTESGFSKIKYIYRHRVKKKGYRILTRKGFVECTEDHSLVIDSKEVMPSKLRVGDRIDLVCFKTQSSLAIDPDLAWLFGFFIAEGTCGIYHYAMASVSPATLQVKYSWRIVNQDEGKLLKAQRIMRQHLGLETNIVDIRKSSATYALIPKNEIKMLVDYFGLMCYRGSNKAIPQCVLNANIGAKKAFIEGLMAGDGSIDENGIVTFDQIHKAVSAGVVAILEELGIEYSLEIREDKSNVCRIRIIKDKMDKRIKQSNIIKKIEIFGIDNEYVYDLETENHHFCGGIGNVLLHNTDSLFLKNPSPTAIDEVALWAHNNLGVDLEIDKQYRYVVFSELKKNYLGVLADGTVDVKGLTGKKSHTPPFIRNAFYDILAILGKVNSEKDFESARESIKNVILENAKNLEARKIPLDDLSFNVTINKSLKTYGKKTGAKTMDGKNADTYNGLPHHIKAANMLVDKGRELRAGDVISYVKTKSGEGVKPVELAKPEEIDTEKYLETMESTFEQVLSALNFDFKSVLGKPRQQKLDELF